MSDVLTLPNIEINFKRLASTFIARSERGIAILIIKDDTDTTFTIKEYLDLSQLNKDKAKYTETNYKYLNDIIGFGVAKLIVVRIGVSDPITNALTVIGKKYKTGWITFIGTTEEYKSLIEFIKVKSVEHYTFKGVVYKTDKTDHENIVNFVNPKVTFDDERGEVEGNEYLPSVIGILCACNVKRGCTYYKCTNLKSVEEVDDQNQALNSGQFILINDFEEVKVGLGINSLITFNDQNGKFDDMRYIDFIEAMHMIQDDVRRTFKDDYIGSHKNQLDDQMIFISAVNTYFNSLAKEDILDKEYDNVAAIDIEAQRKAWQKVKDEAATWSDTKVKNTSFKRSLFLTGDIKILGAMENLTFNIYV
ncbi:phage tail sheath C-terminal domain-containing protein [Clostridium butyricum]|uniref:phage tail sheath C-terminal domain-containing protein n=1 Tax=Clostridium butyricum TaxID=1492 RepID=UPI002ABDC6D9|nr:phage tail sheath C-terminal domain-containing protein [Clostridium butyricum]